MRLFDTLVATRIGLNLPESAILADLGTGPHDQIRRLVAATRATEIDDIAISGCVTAGSVIVACALVGSAQTDGDLLSAIIAGYEAMVGFATAIDGAHILYRGIWPTLAAAPIGAAMVGAYLRGLDEGSSSSAMVFAVGQTQPILPDGAPRWLTLGNAAVQGFAAAEAGSNVLNPDGLVDGWSRNYGISIDAGQLCSGSTAHVFNVDVKSFPTARQALSAIEAFRRLYAQQAIATGEPISIALPAAYRKMVGSTARPMMRIPSMLSAAYQMALAAFAPEHLYDVSRSRLPWTADIAHFLENVTVLEDEALQEHFPARWGGRVTFGGRSAEILDPAGSTAQPFGWRELEAKARRLAAANNVDDGWISDLLEMAREDAGAKALLAMVR